MIGGTLREVEGVILEFDVIIRDYVVTERNDAELQGN